MLDGRGVELLAIEDSAVLEIGESLMKEGRRLGRMT